MNTEKGTGLQIQAIEQQDQVEGGEITQKNETTEQQATQSESEFLEAEGAWEYNHSKTSLGTIPSRVNANAQSYLGHTGRPASVTSDLQAFPIIGSNNGSLPTDLSADQGPSEYKSKVASKVKELETANARFEILQNNLSSLRKELEECYLQDPVRIRERLEDIPAAAIRSNPVDQEVPNRNQSVTLGNPDEIRPSKPVSSIGIPPWGEYFSTESSPVIAAKKAKLSVFSRLAGYTSFFKRGESSAESSLQSAGSNTELTTGPTNHQEPPFEKSDNPHFFKRGEYSAESSLQSANSNTELTRGPTNHQELPFEKSDNAHNQQQASEDKCAAIALRELASKTLHQNNLILSKLGHRCQQSVTSRSTSSRSKQPPSVPDPFVPPTKTPTTVSKTPLFLLYTVNIILSLSFLVAIAWAFAAGIMAERERRMWLQGGETARMASVLLQPDGGFWEKKWGPGARGWGECGDIED